MTLETDEASAAFAASTALLARVSTRIKEVRATPLWPGGRTRLTLFEQPGGEGRPHPRLRTEMPPARDPSPERAAFEPPGEPVRSLETFEDGLRDALRQGGDWLAGTDLDDDEAPTGSPLFWRNTITRGRIARFFDGAAAWLEGLSDDGAMPPADVDASSLLLAQERSLACSGLVEFDDSDTGTFHSFIDDQPFVHYLEKLLEALPSAGSEAMQVLPEAQQGSVARQRLHAQRHLDWLMGHKYAFNGIVETDIERTLGGFLIDSRTRAIVTETEASRTSLVPAYEVLVVDPDSDHEAAGRLVYRDADGVVRDGEHAAVPGEPPIRGYRIDPKALTFRRAPDDPALRAGVRFDWNSDGKVSPGDVEWVVWAGHCDVKAVQEQLGITLMDDPPPQLTEYRSDTDDTTTWDRRLLLEMLTSSLELGSRYRTLDGEHEIERGIHRFGGARNDSWPDRLQIDGPGPKGSFRWPLSGRRESFVVTALRDADGTDHRVDKAFGRLIGDRRALAFEPNPRWLKTVEGDYNLIDVSGMLLEARIHVDAIDPTTGYFVRGEQTTSIDLRADAAQGPQFLGTHVDSAADRTLHRIWLELGTEPAIVAELERWQVGADGDWEAVPVPSGNIRLPMTSPLSMTLSREMRLDDPRVFRELLDIAIVQGMNINADTDMAAEVWNGTLQSIRSEQVGHDPQSRTEHWRVDIVARFGEATLEYLLRRDARGEIEDACPLQNQFGSPPDFLWQELPDVGSKGLEAGHWVVNETLVARQLVELEENAEAQGGVYVYDDHLKNQYEMLFCALGGYPWTVVHDNKRWGFGDEAGWAAAVEELSTLRQRLSFSEPTP